MSTPALALGGAPSHPTISISPSAIELAPTSATVPKPPSDEFINKTTLTRSENELKKKEEEKSLPWRARAERFLIYRYLLEEHVDEMSQVLDFRRLRFKDNDMEEAFLKRYYDEAAIHNRRFGRVVLFIAPALIVWACFTRDYNFQFWLTNSFRVLGFLCAIPFAYLNYLPNYKKSWERFSLWTALPTYISGFTLYMTVYDLFPFVPVVIAPANATDPLVYMAMFGPVAFFIGRFMYVWKGALFYMVVHSVFIVVSQWNRVNGLVWVLVGLYGAYVNGILTAHRKESYYRRIFWLQTKLGIRNTALIRFSHENVNHHQQGPEQSRWMHFKNWIKLSLLMIDPDHEREHRYNHFLTHQSLSQTRASAFITVLSMELAVVNELLFRRLSLLDLILRAGVLPAAIFLFAFCRPILARSKRGPLISQSVATLILLFAIATGFGLAIMRQSDPDSYSNEPTYIFIICQVAIFIMTASGYRYLLFLIITVLYVLTSVIMQWKFKFKDNGFLIGENAMFITSTLFFRQYERTLYLYFDLREKYSRLKRDREKSAVSLATQNGSDRSKNSQILRSHAVLSPVLLDGSGMPLPMVPVHQATSVLTVDSSNSSGSGKVKASTDVLNPK